MGKLTTHILDTSLGVPAQNVGIKLYQKINETTSLIKSTQTNEDGRCNEPLLDEDALEEGCYEIEFLIDNYYLERGIECPFLKDVVIRFYVSNSDENFHVPLLISPYGYSTYRGS
jgi:5-hydroxyisourate hydrolase